MNKTFIKGALYLLTGAEKITILEYRRKSTITKGARFEHVAGEDQYSRTSDGLLGFLDYPRDFRRAYRWSDLPTKKDREKAAIKCDPLKTEEEILRHYAARRARLRHLTPVLGGEYYAQNK